MVKKPIEIDESLYEKVEAFAKENGYDDVNKMVEEMLSDIISDKEKPKMDEERNKGIEERLRKLGYMD
jgi:metal-responsive CopG/Arc/MetJ family transcriptional regulator